VVVVEVVIVVVILLVVVMTVMVIGVVVGLVIAVVLVFSCRNTKSSVPVLPSSPTPPLLLLSCSSPPAPSFSPLPLPPSPLLGRLTPGKTDLKLEIEKKAHVGQKAGKCLYSVKVVEGMVLGIDGKAPSTTKDDDEEERRRRGRSLRT